MTEQALTAQEVADLLQVPLKTLSDWRYKEEYPGQIGPVYFRTGRTVKYWPADVRRWSKPKPQRRVS